MRPLLAIVRRELVAYFLAPMGYVIATTFLLVIAFLFNTLIVELSDPRAPAADIFPLLFSNLFTWIVLLLYTATITMRLVAEEKRTGSIETLLTAPVAEWKIVVGKFGGAFLYYASLWTATLAFPWLLARHARLDPGPIAAGYFGLLLIGAFFLAVGTFASTLTRNQVAAAIVAFSICFVVFAAGILLERLAPAPSSKKVWAYVSPSIHMLEIGRGIVDTRHVVFHASGTIYFLALSTAVLSLGRRR